MFAEIMQGHELKLMNALKPIETELRRLCSSNG